MLICTSSQWSASFGSWYGFERGRGGVSRRPLGGRGLSGTSLLTDHGLLDWDCSLDEGLVLLMDAVLDAELLLLMRKSSTPRGERLIRDAFGDGPVSSSSIAWASENASSTATAAFCDARLATTRSPSAWMRAARVCVV